MKLKANHKINENLNLTEIRQSDKGSIVRNINDKLIYENTLHIPFPYHEKDADEFLKHCRNFEEHFHHIGQFAIRYQGEMIGGIGFLYTYGPESHKAEIGYWIGRDFRGQGIATSAVKKIVEIGFDEKGLFRIEANVFLNNVASMKVLVNAGFKREGLHRKTFIKGDKLVDTYFYACLKPEG